MGTDKQYEEELNAIFLSLGISSVMGNFKRDGADVR